MTGFLTLVSLNTKQKKLDYNYGSINVTMYVCVLIMYTSLFKSVIIRVKIRAGVFHKCKTEINGRDRGFCNYFYGIYD